MAIELPPPPDDWDIPPPAAPPPSSKPVLAFDIETIPDVQGYRVLHPELTTLADEAVAEAMALEQRQRTGNDFIRHHLQRVAVISVLYCDDQKLELRSLGQPADGEAVLVRQFFQLIHHYQPILVSWNGSGFDLPVLHYRALIHGIVARRYWETGDSVASYRFNNYLSRFHWRHVDVMDVLSGYQPRAVAPLDDIAQLLGFPGKLGMSGGKVWDAICRGQLATVRDYCETDVLNTYLVYLQFALMRGELSPQQRALTHDRLRQLLADSDKPHWLQFLNAWKSAPCQTPK